MSDESQISEREREILRLVATGATNQQIAQQLNISINTVKVHLRNIFGKLGVVSRTEATLSAVRMGLVSVERAGTTAVADEPDTPLVETEPPIEPVAPQRQPVSPPIEATELQPVTVVSPPVSGLPTGQADSLPVSVFSLATSIPSGERAGDPPNMAAPSPGNSGSTALGQAPSLAEATPATAPPAAPASRASPLVIGLALVTLLAVGGLIATLLLRPAPVAPTPTSAPTVGLPPVDNRWRALTPLPAPRAAFALAGFSFDNATYLYAIGGDDPETVSGEVLRYDLAGDVWVRFRSKPTPVADVQAVIIGNRIYVPGGRTADGTISAALEAYDPQRDEWVPLEPMPEPRSRYALATVEGKLYLFGGWDGNTFGDQVWRYDPDSDEWTVLDPMPAQRADAGAAVADGQIFLIGGTNADGPLTRNERYSPAEEGQGNPWTIRAPLPAPRSQMGVAATTGSIFVLGGADTQDSALSYDINRDAWQTVELPLDPTLAGVRAQAIGTSLYILGGRSSEGLVSGVFEYLALYIILVPLS